MKCSPAVLLLAALGQCALGQQQLSNQNQCSERIARILDVQYWMDRLRHMPASGTASREDSLLTFVLAQRVVVAVMAATLQVDSALADIDNERSQVRALQDYIQAQKNQSQQLTNIGNLIAGTGLGVVGSSLSLNSSTSTLGTEVGLGSAAASLGLTLYKRLWPTKQRPPRRVAVGFAPRMLSGLASDSRPKRYPQAVWDYLTSNACLPLQITWREQLLREWAGLNGSNASSPEQSEIDKLTTDLNAEHHFKSGTLDDRAVMLDNLRARVSAHETGGLQARAKFRVAAALASRAVAPGGMHACIHAHLYTWKIGHLSDVFSYNSRMICQHKLEPVAQLG